MAGSDLTQRLIGLLGHAEPRLRVAAAQVVGELGIGEPKAIAALSKLAAEPADGLAVPALEALGKLQSVASVPLLVASLGRGGEVARAAREALPKLGAEALPLLRKALDEASPELKTQLAQVLPALGGKKSFDLALEGLLGQPWDGCMKVALAVRAEVKGATPAERKARLEQLERFLGKKGVQAHEPALRAALKMVGYLELTESIELLLPWLGAAHPPLVRVEATTALRFALSSPPKKKVLLLLVAGLESAQPLVAQATRDTLTVVPLDEAGAQALAELAGRVEGELGAWLIQKLGSLGGESAVKALVPLCRGKDRTRAQAASQALAQLPEGELHLGRALLACDDEQEAGVLVEALAPLARKLDAKLRKQLLESGSASLLSRPGLGRRVLDPIRELDPVAWANALRAAATQLGKKEPARAEPLWTALVKSPLATDDDRWALARFELRRSPKDPHPKARLRDPALPLLERLGDAGFALAKAMEKDKQLDEEARFYVAFHFVERATPEARAVGVALLEGIVERSGRSKLGKAAKNKLGLLGGR